MVMGGMMVGRREIPMLLRPFSSVANFRRSTGLLARHAWDRLQYPRGTRLLIAPASTRMTAQLAADGTLATLLAAGAQLLPTGCGACAGSTRSISKKRSPMT